MELIPIPICIGYVLDTNINWYPIDTNTNEADGKAPNSSNLIGAGLVKHF